MILSRSVYHLLHNLLHKHVLAGTLCRVRSVLFLLFFRVHYSTGRSLMSLWLQNHISHLSLTFFFCHLRIGFLFSLCSLSLSLSGGVVTQEAVPRTNQGLVSRDCSVLALETGTHPHTRRVILYTQHPDVKLRVCACVCVCWWKVCCMYGAHCQAIKIHLPEPDLICPSTKHWMCTCQLPAFFLSFFLSCCKRLYTFTKCRWTW